MQQVNVTPMSMHVPREPEVIFKERPERERGPEPVDKPIIARQIYLKKLDFDNYGYTVGCARCTYDRDYGHGRTSRPHTQACKDRIVEELQKDTGGSSAHRGC